MNAPNEVVSAVTGLIGLRCWYVSGGGSAGSSFSLALGGKVARDKPLKNTAHSEDFRHFEGEASLLIWCSWRLDGPMEALASSDELPDVGIPKLERELTGCTISQAMVAGGACDLRLVFDEVTLNVFCDHVPGDPSFDGNWQLSRLGQLLAAGPGFQIHRE
jgi:hypothetical protein